MLLWILVLAAVAAPKPARILTLAELREIAVDYCEPLPTEWTQAKRDKVLAEKLPTGRTFRCEARVIQITKSSNPPEPYSVKLAWGSERRIRYRTARGRQSIPAEQIAISCRGKSDVLAYDRGQHVVVTGVIRLVTIRGSKRLRCFAMTIQATEADIKATASPTKRSSSPDR